MTRPRPAAFIALLTGRLRPHHRRRQAAPDSAAQQADSHTDRVDWPTGKGFQDFYS